MDNTQALYEFIYKNAEMGRRTLPDIISMTNDGNFKKALSEILGDYTEICTEAELNIKSKEGAKGLNFIEKMMTDVSVRLNTISDNSVAHLADMLLKGASMGITDISENLEKYSCADEKAISLGNRLLKLNSDVIDRMKEFLKVTV